MTQTQTHTIKVYSTENCTHCHHVKEYLTEKGFVFTNIDVGADAAAAKEMVEKSGQKGVPVVEIDDNIIVGFDQPIIDELLGITTTN